jgi:hypothetical protein
MGKKKSAAKMAPSAPESSLQDFEAEIAATLNDECTRVQREIYHLKQDHHKNGVYDEIMKLGREEGFAKAKEGFMRALKAAGTTQFERGLKEGEERGRTAEREVWETKREQTEPTTCVTTNTSTQTTSTTTVDVGTHTTPLDEPTATPLPPPSPATSSLATAPSAPSTTPTTSTTATPGAESQCHVLPASST